jgi:hypothetical protein
MWGRFVNKLLSAARKCGISLAVVGSLGMGTMMAFSTSAQAATTWDFRGLTDAPIGIIGGSPNALTFTVDGGTVTASSWHDNGVEATFEGATIAREWTGLGSCNSIEAGDCVNFQSSESTHQVDNQGSQEWVLLVFDGEYSFDSLVHSPFGDADRDASYWVGNINPAQDLGGLTYSDLTGIGFGDRIDTSADFGQGTVTINFGGASGNAILIGARLGDSDDRMKIASVNASVVPLPASAWLMLSSLGMLVMNKRKRSATKTSGGQLA